MFFFADCTSTTKKQTEYSLVRENYSDKVNIMLLHFCNPLFYFCSVLRGEQRLNLGIKTYVFFANCTSTGEGLAE